MLKTWMSEVSESHVRFSSIYIKKNIVSKLSKAHDLLAIV